MSHHTRSVYRMYNTFHFVARHEYKHRRLAPPLFPSGV